MKRKRGLSTFDSHTSESAPGNLVLNVSLDQVAPAVTQFSPADGATGVPTYSNITLTFSEEIQRGVGMIYLRSGSATGSVVESFDAATSSRLSISGTTLTLDPSANLSGTKQYYVTFGAGTVKDLTGNDYAGTTTYDFVTAASDTSGPKVLSYSPADGSTGAATYADIALTFNEAIRRGVGTIYLRAGSSSGTIVESFNAAASDRLSIAGATLTVDPTANLAGNTRYYLTFSSGTVKDLAGNNYGGTTGYDFVTGAADTVAPTVTQFSPADGATTVPTYANIALTFSEAIRKGAGTIELHLASSPDVVAESFDVANSGRVTVSGNVLIIDPTANLLGTSTYYLTFSEGAVKDLAGNGYAGADIYGFTTDVLDVTAPTVTQFTPLDGATSVPAYANIEIKFSEAIRRGSGNIDIHVGAVDGEVVASFDAATSSRLTFAGDTLTINPGTNLSGTTQYFVTFDSGAVQDLTGNAYAGADSYEFTTDIADVTAPAVTQFIPADGATAVPTYANIALTFSEAIERGTGTIRIVASSPTGSVRESFDVGTSSRLAFSGDTLTIDPTLNLAGNTRYYVTFSPDSVKDPSGNGYAGTTSYDFVTAASDTSAPKVLSYSPSDGATGVVPSVNIALNFNEAIQRGVGTIYLRAGSSSGTIVESFNAATSDRLSVSGTTLTVDPTANLAEGTRYFLTLGSGTVKDLAGNNYSGTTSYDFQTRAPDLTAPTVTQFSPADGATGVATSANISVTFSEAVQRGIGTISLHSGSSSGPVVESFDVATSDRLSISGALLTIDPTASLSDGTRYYLTFDSGTVKDLAGNSYAGTASYDFQTAPDPSGFDITINFSGDTQYRSYFDQAAALFETLITQDLPAVYLNGQWIDDLQIDASTPAIDGVGGVLGQAGFTYYRTSSLLPVAGVMDFDSADVASMVASGIFADVVAHEMAHVLGIGTLWTDFGFNSTFGRYTGAQALAEYRLLASQPSASYVPLETGGGSGTANSHWSESVFGRELMTGYASSSGNMPLSRMTVAAFADLGYQVNYNVAEAYTLPAQLASLSTSTGVTSTESGVASIAEEDRYRVVGGTAKDDQLSGSDSNDYLVGLTGRDVITTGEGNDRILLSQMSSSSGVDIITDFTPGTDKLVLDASVFDALAGFAGASGIDTGNFVLDGQAHDANDFLLYDQVTHTLYYDADGLGMTQAKAIAVLNLEGQQALSYLDFLVA